MKRNMKKLVASVCTIMVVGVMIAIGCTGIKAKADGAKKKGLTEYFRKIKMSECDIEIEATEFNWSGQVITPKVTVSYNGETLQINKDYTLKYSGNIDAGLATVKVKGKGDYRGSKKLEFYIKGIDFGTMCTYEYVDNKVVVKYEDKVIDEDEYNCESYYYDTFINDNGIETTYLRTTVYTLYGKGRFEGMYELVTEQRYKENNTTGEIKFDDKSTVK